jgi:hypothetical protein
MRVLAPHAQKGKGAPEVQVSLSCRNVTDGQPRARSAL